MMLAKLKGMSAKTLTAAVATLPTKSGVSVISVYLKLRQSTSRRIAMTTTAVASACRSEPTIARARATVPAAAPPASGRTEWIEIAELLQLSRLGQVEGREDLDARPAVRREIAPPQVVGQVVEGHGSRRQGIDDVLEERGQLAEQVFFERVDLRRTHLVSQTPVEGEERPAKALGALQVWVVVADASAQLRVDVEGDPVALDRDLDGRQAIEPLAALVVAQLDGGLEVGPHLLEDREAARLILGQEALEGVHVVDAFESFEAAPPPRGPRRDPGSGPRWSRRNARRRRADPSAPGPIRRADRERS